MDRGGPLLGDPGMPSLFWVPGKLALFDTVGVLVAGEVDEGEAIGALGPTWKSKNKIILKVEDEGVPRRAS